MSVQTDTPLTTLNFCSVNSAASYQSVSRSRFEFVEFYADTENFSLKSVGMVDTGSSHSLIPAATLPPAILQQLDKSKENFTGISCKGVDAIGEFTADVKIGSFILPKIVFHVLPTACPVLIGQNILRHPAIIQKMMDHKNSQMVLYGNNSTKCSIPLLNGPCTMAYKLLKEVYSVTANDDLESEEDIDYDPQLEIKTDPKSLNNLDEKIRWLKDELEIDLNHHDKAELETFADLLIENREVFGTGDNTLGRFPKLVKIPTNGESRNVKANHIPEAREAAVQEQIDKMLADGIIQVCPDPKGFNSPLVAVKKKDGSIRLCVNFKSTLNQVLKNQDPFPMESTAEVFAKIGPKNKYFSSVDLLSGYWQCELDPEDRHKTAFTWNKVTYEFVRLPFGLSCAGNSFSRQLTEVLKDALGSSPDIHVYLDDITMASQNFEEFVEAHRKVFKALIANGGRLKPKKCQFLKPKVQFLGRIISEKGMEPDPANIQGILEMQAPKTKRQLMSLVGRLVWLKEFVSTKMHEEVKVSSFSHLMEDIYALYRTKSKKFTWTDKADVAFKKIKLRLSNAPFISFSDPNLHYTLTTDASAYGAAGVLMQKSSDGKYHIVACISKTFTAVQRRWSTTEREAFAVVWACEKLQHFLLDKEFTIFTDHKSLCYIDRTEFSNSKIQNWQSKLAKFKFTCQYIEGAQNVFADWLSRADDCQKLPPAKNIAAGSFYKLADTKLKIYVPSWCLNSPPSDHLQLDLVETPKSNFVHMAPVAFLAHKEAEECPEAWNRLDLARAQREDPFLSPLITELEIRRDIGYGPFLSMKTKLDLKHHKYKPFALIADNLYLEPGADILMVKRLGRYAQMVVPDRLRKYYLSIAHDDASAHGGQRRVAEILSDFYWEGKEEDIKLYIDSCTTCISRKGRYGLRPIKTGHNQRGKSPFDIIYIDFIQMPCVRGLKYALTVMCSFTKYLEVYPLAKDNAENTAKCLAKYILKHGKMPKVISCDRGTHFTGCVFKECCKQLGIKLNLHCSWRPQSSGCLERQHRTLKNALFIMAEERNSNWLDLLPYALGALNGNINSSTKTSPFFALTGRKWNIELPTAPGTELSSESALNYGLEVSNCLREAHKAIRVANLEADSNVENDGKERVPCELKVGDEVALYRPMSVQGKNKMPWIPGFTIMVTNQLVSKITDGKDWQDWVHNMHLKKILKRPEDLQIEDFIITPKSAPKPVLNDSPAGGSMPPTQSVPTAKVTKKKAAVPKTVPTRKSSRARKQTEPMVLDPKKKSYANIVRQT